MGYALIVDASIMIAAGGDQATADQSIQAREVLKAIREGDSRLAVAPSVEAEWRTRLSKYAAHWLSDMVDRGRVDAIPDMQDAETRQVIAAVADQRVREILLKDVHLVEAAYVADQRLASGDTACRRHFHAICHGLPPLADLLWIAPSDQGADPWLRAGAPNGEPHRLRNLVV